VRHKDNQSFNKEEWADNFRMESILNPNLPQSRSATLIGEVVYITIPRGFPKKNLIASFDDSAFSVFLGEERLLSGISRVDYSNDVNLLLIGISGLRLRVKVVVKEDWEARLYLPTHIQKFGSLYFLVDCGHNRVLYSDSLERPIIAWNILEQNMGGPHSIASDGEVLVVDDTGKNRIRIYDFDPAAMKFPLLQTIESIGTRPHRVLFDTQQNAFYVVSSNSQTISKFVRDEAGLTLIYSKGLPFLEGKYTRSISILDGKMIFVSGPGKIFETRYINDSYEVLRSWVVPNSISNMNDILKKNDQFLISSTMPSSLLLKVTQLSDLMVGNTLDLKAHFGLTDIPYFFSEFDGKVFLTQIGNSESGLISFNLDSNGNPIHLKTIFSFKDASQESKDVSISQPR
jgi:hypothetical protein